MPKKYVAPFGRCVARRVYEVRSRAGSARRVKVEIGTPAAVPGSDWGCRVRIRGLSDPVDTTIFGIDSIQALSLALVYSGMTLTSSREFLSGRLRLWEEPARNLFEVALPLPMHSLQGALEDLNRVLARLERRKSVSGEWLAGVTTALRNVVTELRRRQT
jgi:hypothetical protein